MPNGTRNNSARSCVNSVIVIIGLFPMPNKENGLISWWILSHPWYALE